MELGFSLLVREVYSYGELMFELFSRESWLRPGFIVHFRHVLSWFREEGSDSNLDQGARFSLELSPQEVAGSASDSLSGGSWQPRGLGCSRRRRLGAVRGG